MFGENDHPDQGFNDAELQGIMEEIESLEKEFAEDDASATISEISEGATEQTSESKVFSLHSKETGSQTQGQQMNFQGAGQLDFEMAFQIGKGEARVRVDQYRGLSVSLNGFDLAITEDGCTVKMEGGATFTVPLVRKKSEQNAA